MAVAISWPAIQPGALRGAMPAALSVRVLAIVTAGLAKEVEAVNQ